MFLHLNGKPPVEDNDFPGDSYSSVDILTFVQLYISTFEALSKSEFVSWLHLVKYDSDLKQHPWTNLKYLHFFDLKSKFNDNE
jgi:hypothetical protein